MNGIPKWVDCNVCVNINTVLCMSCGVKFETCPYLNFATKNSYTTSTTTGINKKYPHEAINCAECIQFINDTGNINTCRVSGINNLLPGLKNCDAGKEKSIMSKEEAIEVIKIMKNKYEPEKYTILLDALDMAIKALENMGCGCGICLSHNNMKCPKMKE